MAAQDCSYTSLLNDAQAQARQVTAAAGVSLNGLLSVSDASVPTPTFLSGDFSAVYAVGVIAQAYYYNPPSSCSVTATYGIGQ